VRLYYGTRNTGATAYSDLDDSWKAAGVDTVHVYSDDNKGYVQDIFSEVRRRCNVCPVLSTVRNPGNSIPLEGVALDTIFAKPIFLMSCSGA